VIRTESGKFLATPRVALPSDAVGPRDTDSRRREGPPLSNVPPEIRLLHRGDEDLLLGAAPGVFDDSVQPALAREFLADPRHRLAVALDEGRIVAMASGVTYVHPDKPTEMWVNELGTAPTHRGRGLGRAVLGALLAQARTDGCAEAWVLTDRENSAAKRLYAAAGGEAALTSSVLFTFRLQ
jgi:GNAT superfamily N-acetyltransferase